MHVVVLIRVLQRLVAVPLWGVGSLAMAAAQPITITAASSIPAHFEVWEDPQGRADIARVTRLADDQWVSVPSGSATYGITSSAYWLRFTLENRTAEPLNLVAELAYSQLDDVVFHVVSGGEVVEEFRTGDTRPFYPRQIDHPNMLLRLDLTAGGARTVYVRAQTDGSMILPLNLWRAK